MKFYDTRFLTNIRMFEIKVKAIQNLQVICKNVVRASTRSYVSSTKFLRAKRTRVKDFKERTFTKIGIFEITLKSVKKIRELFLSISRVFTPISLSKGK